MTPRQFDALLKRHHATKREDAALFELMIAQLTSVVMNTGFRSPKEPVSTREFMPTERAKQAQQSPSPKGKRLTKKRQKELARGIRAMFPNLAKVKR